MSENEKLEQDERTAAEDDVKEDLELSDDSADQVRGGIYNKFEKK